MCSALVLNLAKRQIYITSLGSKHLKSSQSVLILHMSAVGKNIVFKQSNEDDNAKKRH